MEIPSNSFLPTSKNPKMSKVRIKKYRTGKSDSHNIKVGTKNIKIEPVGVLLERIRKCLRQEGVHNVPNNIIGSDLNIKWKEKENGRNNRIKGEEDSLGIIKRMNKIHHLVNILSRWPSLSLRTERILIRAKGLMHRIAMNGAGMGVEITEMVDLLEREHNKMFTSAVKGGGNINIGNNNNIDIENNEGGHKIENIPNLPNLPNISEEIESSRRSKLGGVEGMKGGIVGTLSFQDISRGAVEGGTGGTLEDNISISDIRLFRRAEIPLTSSWENYMHGMLNAQHTSPLQNNHHLFATKVGSLCQSMAGNYNYRNPMMNNQLSAIGGEDYFQNSSNLGRYQKYLIAHSQENPLESTNMNKIKGNNSNSRSKLSTLDKTKTEDLPKPPKLSELLEVSVSSQTVDKTYPRKLSLPPKENPKSLSFLRNLKVLPTTTKCSRTTSMQHSPKNSCSPNMEGRVENENICIEYNKYTKPHLFPAPPVLHSPSNIRSQAQKEIEELIRGGEQVIGPKVTSRLGGDHNANANANANILSSSDINIHNRRENVLGLLQRQIRDKKIIRMSDHIGNHHFLQHRNREREICNTYLRGRGRSKGKIPEPIRGFKGNYFTMGSGNTRNGAIIGNKLFMIGDTSNTYIDYSYSKLPQAGENGEVKGLGKGEKFSVGNYNKLEKKVRVAGKDGGNIDAQGSRPDSPNVSPWTIYDKFGKFEGDVQGGRADEEDYGPIVE